MKHILYASIFIIGANLLFLNQTYGKETATSQLRSRCVITGCSGQICADEEVITTCEYREEYACYKNARCERQADGQCGWTETPELQACLEGNNKSSISMPTPLDIEKNQPAKTTPSWTQSLPSPFRGFIEKILSWIASVRR